MVTHPATRHRGDVITTYLCTARQQQDIVKLLIIIINEYIFIYIKSIVLRSFFVVSVNRSKSNGLLAFRT